jgi:hypothetical protein
LATSGYFDGSGSNFVHDGDLRRVGARGSTCGLVEEVVPDGADGNGRIGQSVRVQISDAPTTVPAMEFFNDDVLDVVSNARISKTSQNAGCFGRERVGCTAWMPSGSSVTRISTRSSCSWR